MRVRAVDCLKSFVEPIVEESFHRGDMLTGLTQMLCQVDVELITASPAANGFFNAKGVSGLLAAGAAHLAAPQQSLGAGQEQQHFTCSAGV